MTFHDDFERVELGADWADDGPIFEDEGVVRGDQFISGGTWQAADSDDESPDVGMGSIRHVANACADQFIEAEVGNFFQGHDSDVTEDFQYVEGEIYLFAQLSPGSNVGIGVYAHIGSGGSGATQGDGKVDMETFTTDADGARTFHDIGTVTPLTGWQTNPNYVIRLEVTAAGHVSAYFEGDLVVESDVTPPGGQHVGIGMFWNRTNYGGALDEDTNPGVPLRVESVTGSLCAGGWRVGRIGAGADNW